MRKVAIIPTRLAEQHFTDNLKEATRKANTYRTKFNAYLELLKRQSEVESKSLDLLKDLGYTYAVVTKEYKTLQEESGSIQASINALVADMRNLKVKTSSVVREFNRNFELS